MKKQIMLSLLLSSFLSLPVIAADNAAGEQKAATCLGCHGDKGQSNNAQFPSLAGQQTAYLSAQLNAFKEGKRNNPMMQHVTSQLNEADIDNLSAYFSGLSRAKAGGDATLAKTGESKAAMCLGCHGDKAQGNGQFPMLAGQQPEYIIKQLNAFKDGSRKSGHMQSIAATLSEDDMKALAAYFGSL